MKKIAILGLHLNYGGVEQTIINQANALSSDYEVELAITYKMREEPAFPLDSKVNVKYLTKVKPNKEEFKKHIKNRSFIKAFKEGIKSLRILHQKKRTMIEYIENSDADIIISSRVEFAELLGKYKKDNVITITEEHCHHNNNKKYINRLKKACKKIDYLIAVSQELTNFYKKEMPYINCIYMPNSLSTSQTYSSKLNNKNLISVGRLSPEKGYLDLVDMFKILHDKDSSYHLDIIGNGPEYAKINDKIKNLNLESSIKLWGFQSTEFINKKMENSSLYVMCSYEESFGIVLIEAGANGVPSIALDSAKGAMEIIEDEHNGYLIPNRNLELMAEKIDNLMNNPKLLKQFGKNAKEKSNQFTFENIKQNWLNLIPTLNNKKSNVIKYFEKLYNNHVSEFYKIVEKNLELEKRMFIVTSNPETFAYGKKEPEFDKMLLDNDTTLIPDGIGIVKAANMLNYDVKERITGVDLAYKLLELANIHKYKVAIIGATEAVITELKKVIKEKYPNIELLKIENGYVENKDDFFDEISIKQPDICLVALGIPNQEKLIYKHLKRFKKGIFVGVGGSLDVISGTKKRAPKLFQKLNLEWLYRILKEPKRLKRFYDNNIKFIFKIQKLKKGQNKLKTYMYFIMLFIFYFLIAVINQYYIYRLDIKSYLDFNMLFFCLYWTVIFIIIRLFLTPKFGKYSTFIFQIALIILTITNYFYSGYFGTIFSWKDLVLSSEGLTFISSIYPLITLKLILVTLFLFIYAIVMLKFSPKNNLKIYKKKKVIILLVLLVLIITYKYISIHNSLIIEEDKIFNDNDSRAVLNNDKVIYSEWINSKSALKICGIYQYIIRDLYLIINNNENPIKAKKQVNELLKDYKNNSVENSKYYGMFEGKNLILVMMESADDWQINEKSTPTIYKMKKEGIDFVNHHSLSYVTGQTAQSEFIANTGIYPKFNSVSPHYAYVKNDYKYSIANLFKNKGYTVNAFHRTVGQVYNRENMMLSLGYEHYYYVYALQMEESQFNLDRYYAINGYNAMTQSGGEKPFMSFYITFSNHSPYSLEKSECSLHFDEMKKLFPNESDETKLCGYAQMHETDLFFKELLEKLERDNILEDTVIIAFSDHPNYLYLSDKEDEKINYTEMFIYNPSIKHEEINKLTNTINILPMINTLFKLESPYYFASYDPLTSEESYIVFNDYTYYNGNEILPLNQEQIKQVNISKNILISDYYR